MKTGVRVGIRLDESRWESPSLFLLVKESKTVTTKMW